VTTVEVLPQLGFAAVACSAAIVEFTIPQIIALSQKSTNPLPPAKLFPHRAAMFTRSMPAQSAITAFQFVLVREVRDRLDVILGNHAFNLSIAYGAASVPFIAWKYNLLNAGVYTYMTGRSPPVVEESRSEALRRLWSKKIKPGLLWSYLRDTGSIGGAIVLGPQLSQVINKAIGHEDGGAGPVLRFCSGVVTGSLTGFATQLFHNAALTAGRMAELGQDPTNAQCMRTVLQEHGKRAVYMNFPFRVAIIAFWSAVLNVADPFQRVAS